MNITKLNQRIDDIEDEIYREKLKIKKVADELGETFDDMLAHYWPTNQHCTIHSGLNIYKQG